MQLMMEDAIDDWLLRQIHWLRREDVIAEGIKWVQDVSIYCHFSNLIAYLWSKFFLASALELPYLQIALSRWQNGEKLLIGEEKYREKKVEK